jgi:hypothetical protein
MVPTTAPGDCVGLRAPIGRREMQSPDTSKNIPNASVAREFISIGSCLHVLIVAAPWFDITTLKSCITFPTAQAQTNVWSSNEGPAQDKPCSNDGTVGERTAKAIPLNVYRTKPLRGRWWCGSRVGPVHNVLADGDVRSGLAYWKSPVIFTTACRQWGRRRIWCYRLLWF